MSCNHVMQRLPLFLVKYTSIYTGDIFALFCSRIILSAAISMHLQLKLKVSLLKCNVCLARVEDDYIC